MTDRNRMEALRKQFGDQRSLERIEAHLDCELRLAERLRSSTAEERKSGLYTEVYNSLFALLPDHPQHHKAEKSVRDDVERQVALVSAFAEPGCRVMEIGAGDAAVSRKLQQRGYDTVAVDVSDGVADTALLESEGVSFVLTDGTSFSVPNAALDFVYSNQLIEHLHPDDACTQMVEVARCLKQGGIYYVVTPSKLTGPHDISVYLGDCPKGLHLREYGYADLAALGKAAGFSYMKIALCRGDKVVLTLPATVAIAAEWLVASLQKLGIINPSLSRIAVFLLGVHALFRK